MASRPNILFVVFDQMRADCLFGALAETVELSNFRAFMAESVAFTNHISVTSPCGPARASLLTGQYAMNHRSVRNGTPLPMDKPNLATELRRAGITPLLYGYTDTAADPRHYDAADPILTSYEQVMNGFVEAVEFRFENSRTWRGYLADHGYDALAGDDLYVPVSRQPDSSALYHADHSDTAFLTNRLLADLPTRGDGWCAHVTFIRPHPPFVAPAPYNRLVDPVSMPRPFGDMGETFATAHPFNAPAMAYRQARHMVCGFPNLIPSLETTAKLRAVYMGLVAELDHHFGRIIANLKSRGQYEDTLIIVTSDHGELLGDQGCWGKMNYLDAAYRVPLIIRVPGARPARVNLPTESVDVMPTILDWLGEDCPDTVDGHSLMPLAKGKVPHGWRDYSVSELDFGDPVSPTLIQQQLGLSAHNCGVAILRTVSHSLVHFNGGLPPILFDHEGEGEGRNIAGDSGADTVRLALLERLVTHRMRYAEGRFSNTMITADGVVRGSH